MSFLLAVWTLWIREFRQFYRQRSRVIGAVGSPIVFWALIGSGIGSSFKSDLIEEGMTYSAYYYPGTLLLILLFTAIFSTFSLIEDRKDGFLQAVLVSPASRTGIVLGKILGATTISVLQCVLFLLFAPWIGIHLSISQWLIVLGVLAVNSFALSSLGFLTAWHFNSMQGYHAVMNLFLFPLWILSGALFPVEGAAGWIQIVMKYNPLTYGMDALRFAVFPNVAPEGSALTISLGIVGAFGLVMLAGSSFLATRRNLKNSG